MTTDDLYEISLHPRATSSIVSCVCTQSLQLYSTLRDPMNCSSSVHGMLQARMLEWVAMPSSRGPSRPRDRTHLRLLTCIGRWVLYH